jgi:carbon monoxide dehydrogenase subunit G
MHLEHEFVVPVPVKQAWEVLLDIERIAPCMPGATVDSVEGDAFAGRVKVKVGPITVTYRGTASFLERDEDARRVTIKADGREARGSGTAAATIVAALYDEGERTRVTVDTELAVTGRPAQFGRGVMVDVSNKLLATFTDCLERTLASEQEAPAPVAGAPAAPTSVTAEPTSVTAQPTPAAPAAPAAVATPREAAERPTPEAIDLLETAGAPVLKRVAPAVAVVGLLVVLWWVLRRIRS